MGSNINEHKNKIFRAMQMDCDVICHAWDHSDLTQLSGNAIKKQLADTIAAIETITGKAPPMFRPPHGFVNKKVLKISRKLGLATVFWSVDPMDWMVRDADAVYSYIMENVKDEDIVLCHDVHETTAVAMSRVIPQLIAQGYQLVTVTQLLTKKYGKIIPGEMYCKLS
jgi:peptidoglycan/xylan/chitin deacetylase (PgdA/CDA1 family)